MPAKIQLKIPDSVQFSDLKLALEPEGLSFDWTPIERICGHNGITIATFRESPEENVADLITHWYAQHLAAGGERDVIADTMIDETIIEDQGGVMPPTRGRDS